MGVGNEMRLNKEQEKISYMKPSGHALIKGIAGSGKTTVGIYRIPFLLNNYCGESDDSILLVTYNKTLVNYMNYIYSKIAREYREAYPSLFELPKQRVKITTVDSLLYPYFLRGAKRTDKTYTTNIGNGEKMGIVKEYIEKLAKDFKDVTLLRDENTKFLYDEINWIKSCNYLEEEYQSADRIGIGRHEEHIQRIPKNSSTRAAIYQLMEYSTLEINERGKVDFNDIRSMALEEVRRECSKRYTHIIIDESQDLSKLQLEFIKELYNDEKSYSSLTFLFDSSQSIYSQSWLGNGRNFTSIGYNMVGKSKSLSKNFRTTTQISQAAYSLLKKSTEVVRDENYVKPFLVDKQGEYPVYRNFSNEREELEYLRETLVREGRRYNKNEILVVARSRNQLEIAKKYLEENNISASILDRDNDDFESDAVRLMTMHSVKGIESKLVILININDGVLPYYSSTDETVRELEEVMEKKLLYVGMTRATEQLYILSNGTPSQFIGEIDSDYLRLRRETRCRTYSNISIEDYIFSDKILNKYSSEEKIRQWVLGELIKTYGYPQENLEIEYPVQLGSKKGFTDIAVFRYEGSKRVPFILIEVKAGDSDMESALEQLKSYMAVTSQAEYGVATNGRELFIINREGIEVKDIPEFTLEMMATEAEETLYLDLRRDRKLSLVRDDNGSGELKVDYGDIIENYSKEEQKKIPIYGKISAGIPIFMNNDLEEEISLPLELLKTEDCFALKVKGDSMTGADIDDGDYVILRQDISANSGDIVAAALEDEATLKRLMKMRNSIILLPENPEYEEIYINEQDVNLLGVAVGVIKRSKNVL